MAKKSRNKEEEPKEVVANCDNQQLAVAKCDIKNMDIKSMIRDIRGQQVMLDFELAKLYGVETKALNQAVKRNKNRFPDDFMFQLTKSELEALRSQIVTANSIDNQKDTSLRSQIVTAKSRSKVRTLPYAFTRNGIGMLTGPRDGSLIRKMSEG